ncbi:hypothetical protein DFJ63DRAFT_103256 [Scheffersomyces coipomensis]|uniref:uncharacterized protein n=1 Tax=Scheffersomyces coipomensis TaxID=1788519 RepID=UPI00315CECCE
MSAPLINRSLTTIKTELEFLKDSDVITEGLYEKLLQSIPSKYQKDQEPWGVDKLGLSNGSNEPTRSETDKLSEKLSQTTIAPPAYPPAPNPEKILTYCRVIYDFQAQQKEDLELKKGEKVIVTEHLSADWWKGYRKGSDPEKGTGVFPSNYVTIISEQEYNSNNDVRNAAPVPSPQPLSQQPSYGGYAQYPPQPTNYYPPQQYQQPPTPEQSQQQPQPQPQHHTSDQFKKFGSKLGNAAIFGAGATIGSDLINSIF